MRLVKLVGAVCLVVFVAVLLRQAHSPEIADVFVKADTAYAANTTSTPDTSNTVIALAEENEPPSTYAAPLQLVAHAGGVVDGYVGTNSLEALLASASSGFEYVELDLITTTDMHVVANHDWQNLYNRVAGAGSGQVSHQQFMSYKICGRFTPIDLPGLIDFLDENQRLRIITDTKETDYAALHVVSTLYPGHVQRFIPQAYAFEDIPRIKQLGFSDIIVTLYMLPHNLKTDAKAITALAIHHGVFGITIPDELAQPSFIELLELEGIRHFAHTINTSQRAMELAGLGFVGVYTGRLWFNAQEGQLVVNEETPQVQVSATDIHGRHYLLLELFNDRLTSRSMHFEEGRPSKLSLELYGAVHNLEADQFFVYMDRAYVRDDVVSELFLN